MTARRVGRYAGYLIVSSLRPGRQAGPARAFQNSKRQGRRPWPSVQATYWPSGSRTR